MRVYEVSEVWKELNREGILVARCTVQRLMRREDLCGVMPGRRVRASSPDSTVPRPMDRVNRHFKAERPTPLWVSDFTYVSPWQGRLHVAFVIDVFARRIAGGRVSASMTTDFVLNALEQALYTRQPAKNVSLIPNGRLGATITASCNPWAIFLPPEQRSLLDEARIPLNRLA